MEAAYFKLTVGEIDNFCKFVDDFSKTNTDGGFKFTVPKECMPEKHTLDEKFLFKVVKQKIIKSGKKNIYMYSNFKPVEMNYGIFLKMGNELEKVKDDESFWKKFDFKAKPLYGLNVEHHLFEVALQKKVLNVNKMNSILSGTKEFFEGVHSSMLYICHPASTFALHTEDMDLHSISYNHSGDEKVWYVVDPNEYDRVVQILHEKFGRRCSKSCEHFERHKYFLPTPQFFEERKIKFKKIVQHEGEYVVTLSRAFHWGFNRGVTIAEASNFRTPQWIPNGRVATVCTCE